jgi:hypothetical protein
LVTHKSQLLTKTSLRTSLSGKNVSASHSNKKFNFSNNLSKCDDVTITQIHCIP